MPYPNEHSCRMNPPGNYERFARDNDADPNRIFGIKADNKSEVQAYRYPTDTWTEARARAHCEKKGGTFEAAGKGAKAEALEFTMYGFVGEGSIDAREISVALGKATGAEQIVINLNSPGGNVTDALAIYTALTRHPARVLVNIDGLAGSSASVIAMAGDEIRIAANAMVMIHDPTHELHGTSTELRKTADVLDKLRDAIVRTYANRVKLGEDEIRAMMEEETWLDAEEAVRHGFADEIVPAKRMAATVDPARVAEMVAGFKNVPSQWLATVLAKQQASDAETGDSEMAGDDKAIDLADVKAEGAATERARFDALAEAFEDKAFVAEMYADGADVEKAQAIFKDREHERMAGEVEAKAKQIQDLEKQVKDLTTQIGELKKVQDEGDGDALPARDDKASNEPQGRAEIIAQARAQFLENREVEAICSEQAWVDTALYDAGGTPLSDDEVKELNIRRSA